MKDLIKKVSDQTADHLKAVREVHLMPSCTVKVIDEELRKAREARDMARANLADPTDVLLSTHHNSMQLLHNWVILVDDMVARIRKMGNEVDALSKECEKAMRYSRPSPMIQLPPGEVKQ